MAIKKEKFKTVKAYICSTNWDFDVPGQGVIDNVFLDLKKLQSKVCTKPTVDCKYYCGIYELEIKVKKVIKKGNICAY